MTQISRYQVILMLVWVVLGTGILTMPGTIAQFTVHDAWLGAPFLLLGGGLSAGVAWVHVRLFPGLTLTQAVRAALGPWIGGFLAAWLCLWLLITTATVGREMSAFVTVATLPNTAEYVVGAAAFACVAYLVHLGIEVVGRVNEFIMPLVLVIVPILFVLALRWFDIAAFQPVWAEGFTPIWRSGIVPAFAYGLEFVVALQWVPALRTPRTLPLDILIAAAVSSLILTVLVVETVGVVGWPVKYMNYPVLEVVRAIRLGKLIERLDTVYAMGVVAILVLKLSAIHLSLCRALQDVCGTQDARWAVLPAAFAVWAASYFLFRNTAGVTAFILSVVPGYFLVTAIFLPLLSSAAAWLRRKPWRRTAAGRL
ncbi:GerAB/ArcD/ProY family transporter [Alicyclobacillus kakegawensis]|uniref:GerAB/ArcD/ProY family transporter n=1 Tax=Alicyclobacillus kakegawensis TaxID=392012 RepID=UPI00082FC6B4|nr:endospore germination permease [Alicyclobacillus kakegawensis]